MFNTFMDNEDPLRSPLYVVMRHRCDGRWHDAFFGETSVLHGDVQSLARVVLFVPNFC
jgi:hypothetical protein